MKRQHSSLALLAMSAALGFGLLGPSTGYAHDFGGPSTGGTGPDELPPQIPCAGDECVPDCDGGGAGNPNSPPTATAGKPVSLYTGAETYSATDLVVRGAFPIRLARRYDSQSQFDSPLGYGWGWVFDRRLYEYADGSVVIRHSCGYRNRFVQSGGAYVTPPGGMPGTLSELLDGTFVFLHAHGLKDFYDLEGRLSASEDVRGNRHEYTYDAAGKLPIRGHVPANRYSGNSQFGQAGISATSYRLTRIDERAANGVLTGHYVTFDYDSDGRVSSVSTNDGRVVTYGHETVGIGIVNGGCTIISRVGSPTNGNLSRVTFPDGAHLDYTYGYDICDYVLYDHDPKDDHFLTGIYDNWTFGAFSLATPFVANGRFPDGKVSSQNVRGTGYSFEYLIPYARTRVTKTVRGTDGTVGGPGGYTSVSTYDFDSIGRVTKIIDALGNEKRFVYNSAGFLESKEIWQNNSGTLARLQSASWTYDGIGNMLTESTTLDGGEFVAKSWSYDHGWIASEQVVSSASPTKIFRTEYTFFYNAEGFPKNIHEVKLRRDDGSFQTITYDYDSRNRYKGLTHPDGVREAVDYTGEFVTKSYVEVGGVELPQLKVTFERDARGNVVKNWDARNNLTERAFDVMDRLTSETNPRGEKDIYTYEYGALRLVEKGNTVADGTGQVTRLELDTQTKRVTKVQRRVASGQFVDFVVFGLNSDGEEVTVTDAEYRTWHTTYDLLGRISSTTDPLGKTTAFAYDAAGNLIRITDPLTRQTRLEYDDLNRRTAVVHTGVTPNPRTEMTYDAVGNVTSVRDPENRITAYEYDALSRNTRVTQPLGQQTQFYYDNSDRLDYLLTARNQKVDYDYEAWGPLREEKHYPTSQATTADRTISYSFDNDGNILSVTDSGVQAGTTYGFTYDSLSRIYDETVHYLPGGDRTLQHRYDRYGNRNQLTVVDGGSTVYDYTFDNYFNRLTNASLAGSALSLSYFANDDRQTISLPNGVSRSYTYKANGPVNTIGVSGPSGSITQFSYAYDDVLNVDTLTDADGVHDYGYDGLNRLTTATHPLPSGLPASEGFIYTGTGDRKDSATPGSWTFDNNHRITGSPGLTYGHDADGNLQSRSDSMTLTHDARQRLTQVIKAGTTSSYLHDVFGRRVRKTVGSTNTWFLWDGTELLSEYDGSGTRTKRYAYLPGDYTPTQVQDANGTYYVHSDHLDAPRLITNASAQVVWRARYEAFGKALVQEDPDGNSVAVSLNLRFPGQYFDAETGLYYNYQRSYDAALGRYIQSDPLGQTRQENLYAYAFGNPLGYIDPDGEQNVARPVQRNVVVPRGGNSRRPPGERVPDRYRRETETIPGSIPPNFPSPPNPAQDAQHRNEVADQRIGVLDRIIKDLQNDQRRRLYPPVDRPNLPMPMCRIGDEEANRRKEKRRSEVRNSCVREYSDIPYCSNYADTVVQ